MSLSRSLVGVARQSGFARRGQSLGLTLRHPASGRRTYADSASSSSAASDAIGTTEAKTREAWLFIDSVFPITFWRWDPRKYIGILRQDTVFEELSSVLGEVKAHDFHLLKVEPQMKDGGVFVQFEYSAGDPRSALDTIMHDLHLVAAKQGGMPTWWGAHTGGVWFVKGTPWREDLNRYASPIVKIAFDGPDVKEEVLYELLRPYGHIIDIVLPAPAPAGTLRAATVTFSRARSAAIARNTIHGLAIPADNSGTTTRLRTSYQVPIQAHVVRDFIASHPRIFLPVVFFLLGTLTYAVFDPIRIFMVEGKINDWFDHRQYRLYKWLKNEMVERFSLAEEGKHGATTAPAVPGVWKERQDAEAALTSYLSDVPNTVTFLFGPQGSGKTHMVTGTLKDARRKTLVIDVAQLSKATSDAALISGLARQTGYWPVFSFLNSMNNLIDLASMGLIGQKAGLSSSLTDQLKQVLETVGTGLRSVNTSYRKRRQEQLADERHKQQLVADEAHTRQRIAEGTWHDPRLDCVAGNGVMCELGIGDEDLADAAIQVKSNDSEKEGSNQEGEGWHWKWNLGWNGNNEQEKKPSVNTEEMRAIEAMPIVVINNFDTKGGSARKAELLEVLAQWAATLADNGVAHVVVVSDNRENVKQLAKALPSKPLNIIALSDADSASALSLVKQKLQDAQVEIEFGHEETSYVERLGGRAEDLESLVHKVRSGMDIKHAVEDIVHRGVGELRKLAFGDDSEDAKNLPWSREQAWFLLKQLAAKGEIAYYEALVDFPFKGDETPLRELEHAELISIVTDHGRPALIRPGKPVYKYVFERLVNDPVFQANQDIAFNTKVIAANETIVKTCEEELQKLNELEYGSLSGWFGSRAVSTRGKYLLKKMRTAAEKIESLDEKNVALKKVLAKGG